MRIIYSNPFIIDENYMWYVANKSYGIPLLCAADKVGNVKRNLVGGHSKLTPLELAKIQTCRKANNIMIDRVTAITRHLRDMMRAINAYRETVSARKHAIKQKLPRYHKRKGPVNEQLKFAGQDPISGHMDFLAATRDARIDCANLLRDALPIMSTRFATTTLTATAPATLSDAHPGGRHYEGAVSRSSNTASHAVDDACCAGSNR
ncbi:hypothetical protein KEM52_001746 [Ascosphaera acerosa]|nr:hypothetical protein KEM52_001746 [Ascosphaera acerosa]